MLKSSTEIKSICRKIYPKFAVFANLMQKNQQISEDGDVDVVESEELSPDKKQGDNDKNDNEEEHEGGEPRPAAFADRIRNFSNKIGKFFT